MTQSEWDNQLKEWQSKWVATTPMNRYDAAQPAGPKRSYIPAFVQDARYDASPMSRWEMTRKMRYFDRNVWLVNSVKKEHIKWTVGPNGLQIKASSSEPVWNAKIDEAYANWCESPCLDSTISMSQVHKQIAGSDNLEGGIFILKTYLRELDISKPAIQLIESHRCSSPGTAYSDGYNETLIDGVQLAKDSSGRITKPIGYHFLNNVQANQWVFRSVQDVIHVFDPERAGTFREITPWASVMNSLHDLDDLEQLEMEKAKQNSEFSNIITNQAGELNADAWRASRWNSGIATTNSDPKSDDQDRRISIYKKILGSRTIALKTGEKLEQFGSESPSASTQWYWQYKIGQICKVGGVPLILIFPELCTGIQGTVVRGIYDNAHETFRSKFFLYAVAAIKMWRFFVNWARYNLPEVVDAPSDWAKCHVIPPRAVNVDVGYTSAATLAELAAGVTNYDDIAGRYGTTAEVLLRKKARNIALIHSIAKEEKVKPEEIAEDLADIVQKLALATQAESIASQQKQLQNS